MPGVELYVGGHAGTLPGAGVRRVHIFGVLYLPALGGLLWLADQYGLEVSTDSTAPMLACAFKNRKKSGARAEYWRDNVAWSKAALGNLREDNKEYYREPAGRARMIARQAALRDYEEKKVLNFREAANRSNLAMASKAQKAVWRARMRAKQNGRPLPELLKPVEPLPGVRSSWTPGNFAYEEKRGKRLKLHAFGNYQGRCQSSVEIERRCQDCGREQPLGGFAPVFEEKGKGGAIAFVLLCNTCYGIRSKEM
jgi:hypothetical protein